MIIMKKTTPKLLKRTLAASIMCGLCFGTVNPAATEAYSVNDYICNEFLFIYGDLNGNSKVELSDAMLGLEFALGVKTPNKRQLKAASFENGEKVSLGDVQTILQRALNIDSQTTSWQEFMRTAPKFNFPLQTVFCDENTSVMMSSSNELFNFDEVDSKSTTPAYSEMAGAEETGFYALQFYTTYYLDSQKLNYELSPQTKDMLTSLFNVSADDLYNYNYYCIKCPWSANEAPDICVDYSDNEVNINLNTSHLKEEYIGSSLFFNLYIRTPETMNNISNIHINSNYGYGYNTTNELNWEFYNYGTPDNQIKCLHSSSEINDFVNGIVESMATDTSTSAIQVTTDDFSEITAKLNAIDYNKNDVIALVIPFTAYDEYNEQTDLYLSEIVERNYHFNKLSATEASEYLNSNTYYLNNDSKISFKIPFDKYSEYKLKDTASFGIAFMPIEKGNADNKALELEKFAQRYYYNIIRDTVTDDEVK